MLTDTAVRTAKPRETAYKMADGHGLYLMVMPNGGKYWRLKYRVLGKEKKLSIGVYPEISLAEAREKGLQARKQLVSGVDPSFAKKEQKRHAVLKTQNTFEAVAREWHGNQLEKWTPKHAQNVVHFLETDIFPFIGNRPIEDIEPPELLEVLRKIEKRGAIYMAGRVKQICGQVFRYGVATGRCKRDASTDLNGALKTQRTKHFAALDIKEMPEFLRALENNDARLFAQTRRGIRLLMLTFVRTSELINSTWDEFDLENGHWEIPAERMKMRNAHLVPLSRQAVALLRQQKEETAHFTCSKWVFPNHQRPLKPMSNNAILFAIGRLGYKGRMTGHGFRALAMSTIKERLGYRHEVVDRQLAHAPRSKVDRAYDRAQFLEDRRNMMQQWADFLDSVAGDNKIILGKFGNSGG